MTIKLNCNNIELEASTILWDRDSYFIDFAKYWSRLTGTIAQKIAEHTTDNWGTFNLVRTEVIKILGINPENENALAASSPVNITSVALFPTLLKVGLRNLIIDKNSDDMSFLFHDLVIKALQESKKYIKDSVFKSNLETVKNINKKTKQILVTNDNKENNDCFLNELNIIGYFHDIYSEKNKEFLDEFLKENVVFITSNSYLKNSYEKRGIKNILLTENLINLSVVETTNNDLITINIDGASRGNPGPASIGIVFIKNEETIKEASEYIGNGTNNHAEYTALIRALEISLENNFNSVEVKSDSELVVNQINKKYKVKDPDIKELFDKAYSLIEKMSYFKITHIVREKNLKADKLANAALNQLRNV